METQEFIKKLKPINNGFLHLPFNILFFVGSIILIVWIARWDCMTKPGINPIESATDPTAWITLPICLSIFLVVLWIMHLVGFMLIQPNQSQVLTFFGKYSGTVKDNGYFWVNPFYKRQKISLRARNMDVAPIKVNDKSGNPIMIGLVLVWKIENTYKACFDIDTDMHTNINVNNGKEGADSATMTLKGYDSFVKVQSDAALRRVAGMYAYDNIENKNEDITLRGGGEEINERLENELRSRLSIAGIEVIEARINYLAYAAEIASVMLRRQQADAIIAAREKIVEGAVSMVELALKQLNQKNVVQLDEEKKASMVSNLLVVLCADEAASPVINAGTLY